MKKQLQDFRNQIICDIWEDYKGQLSMEDLAVLFNISLKSIYRILKVGEETKIN